MKESLEQLQEKTSEVINLEKQIKELQEKLHHADAKLLEKVSFTLNRSIYLDFP